MKHKYAAVFNVFSQDLSSYASLIPASMSKFLSFPLNLSGRQLWNCSRFRLALDKAASEFNAVRLSVFEKYATKEDKKPPTISDPAKIQEFLNELHSLAILEEVELPDFSVAFEVFEKSLDLFEKQNKDVAPPFTDVDVIYLANIGVLAAPVEEAAPVALDK